MEKTIKYLENGEYHYATVKDVGDLAKLKTDSKDDLVAAINDLFENGGKNAGKPEGYDNLVNNIADAIQKQQQISSTITDMQQTAQLSDAEMAHMKQVQEELHQEYLKAVKELNKAIEKAKADATALDKKTNDMQDKIDETFADVNKEVSDVHKQLDAEAKGLHKDLDETKTNLETTRKDLLNSTQEYGQVHSEVKELQDKFNRRVWSTDLDPVREQVSKNSTEVQQTKDELKNKADQSSLDLVTNSVENLSTQVKQNASGLEVAVKRDELGGDVARLLGDKTNLLLGTRSFSGEDNWRNRDKVTIEPGYYKGMKTAAVQVLDGSIYQPYRVKANTAYTFSFFGKEDRDNPKAKLAIKPIDAKNINIDNEEQVVHITTEWQRFAVTFSVDKECDVSIQVIQGPEASNNVLHLAGLKLQYGQNNTPWEPNEADVAENIEHTESQFNVYSDQIAGIVKKQEKMGDKERQLDTRITETAKGLEQTSKDIQVADGKINEFNGKLESTAQGLKTEYEKYTNEAIGQISDSSLNLIHNSAFSNRNSDFDQWQNVSAKVNIREDNNQLRWAEITQSGLTSDNPVGLTSNYFSVKQGKVTVAVDIKSGEKATLDNPSVLFIELYDQNKKRVDFQWVNLNDLGLSTEILSDHLVHRGMYRKAIDRADAKYMTVKAHVMRNGDLWFTNFSARLSSIDDGGYTPNPDDVNHQILKMNTKIEEDAEHIALKANSVDVTRDIKDAVQNSNGGGINLLRGTGSEWKTLTGSVWFCQTTGAGAVELGSFTTGDTVTYSITVRNNSQYAVRPEIVGFSDDNGTRSFNISGTESARPGETKTVSVSATVAENTVKIIGWLISSGAEPTFSVDAKNEKLERGSVATPWSPAPEDTSAEIKSAKDAAIQVASDQINFHVNELSTQFDDKLNKRINEQKTAYEKFTSDGIEQTVRKITDVKSDVNNLKEKVDSNNGGGINLLRGTGSEWKTLTGSVWFCQTTGAGAVELGSFTTGDTVTYSITVRNNSQYAVRPEIVGFSDDNGTRSFNISGTESARPGETKTVSVSATVAENTVKIIGWLISSGAEPTFSVDAKNEKLERGSVATPWSPAPEDINQTIKDATEYKIVIGTIDFNNLKTQQKIFYKDSQATNAPAGGNYWYYLDVEPGYDGRILQTAISDRDNITWVRTFAESWTPWIRQADKRNVDYLNDQISSFKKETTASVKNLGDRVTTEVNSVTKKINNIQVGGRNYLRNSDKSITGFGQDLGTMPNEVLNSLAGKTITVSADVEWSNFVSTSGVQNRLGFEMSVHRSDGKDQWFGAWVSPTTPNGKERVSTTFDVPAGLTYTVSNNDQNGYVSIKGTGTVSHAKVEVGNKPTDWSPAPEDTAEVIKSAKDAAIQVAEKISELNTKWEVANGQIQGKVTETDVNNILNGKGYATQSWAESNFRMKSDSIDLEVRKITDPIINKINSNNGGGVNLLKGTADFSGDWLYRDTEWDRASEKYNGLTVYKVHQVQDWCGLSQYYQVEAGQTYTFSAYARYSSGTGASYIFLGLNSDPENGHNNASMSPDGRQYSFDNNWKRVEITFTVSKSGYIKPRLERTNNNKNVLEVCGFKLERGSVATPWSPNPFDVDRKIGTQTLDNADINDMKTQGHYFVRNLTGNPIPGWVYVDVTGNNNDRIRQDVYGDQSYVHKFRSWNGSRWTDWEEEVKNTDIISKINISPENIKLSSSKIEIDGNTYIHGELNVPTVKLNGKNGSIDLSGDGIHIGGSKGDIKLDSGGIDITKNGQGLSITGDYIQVVTDSNGQKEVTGLIGSNFNLKNKNQNGLALLVTPQQELGRPYGGDLLTIGELEKSGEVTSAVTFDATNITGDGAGFHWTAPHYLHGPAQAIHITETQDNLTLLPLKMPHSSQENYYQPALTVTHGIDGNGNYVHGDSGVEFLWNSIKPYGSVDMTDARLWVYGVDHGIKNVWVSWSNWDGGERYPALVNDIGYWGGIAFPKSGRVTLFDADGRYYCPEKSTGLGAYDNYMGKNNNWH